MRKGNKWIAFIMAGLIAIQPFAVYAADGESVQTSYDVQENQEEEPAVLQDEIQNPDVTENELIEDISTEESNNSSSVEESAAESESEQKDEDELSELDVTESESEDSETIDSIEVEEVEIEEPALEATATSYSVDDALAYAASNWNTNSDQLCAEFVSRCVMAGGLSGMTVQKGTGGCWKKITTLTGLSMQTLSLNSSGYATKSLDGNILAAGDVVVQWCTTHSIAPHIMICAGYDSSGYAVFYAHNAAMNKARYKLSVNTAYEHTTSCDMGGKVIRLSTLDSSKNVTQTSHVISFEINDLFGHTLSSQTVTHNASITLPLGDLYTKPNYTFGGWNARRNSDNKYYVAGTGWFTESEIKSNGYTKKVYKAGANQPFDDSWTKGSTKSNDSFTFVAVWNSASVTQNSHKFSFEINDSYGSTLDSQTVSHGSKLSIPGGDAFIKYTKIFAGWYAKRNSDNTYFVEGQGWFTDSTISKYGFSKKLYAPGSSYTITDYWTVGSATANDSFTLVAVWNAEDEHHWDNGVITKEPTVTECGTRTYTCSVCKYSRSVRLDKLAAGFNDVSSSAYYYDAVQWAVSEGITSGSAGGTVFNPNATCTRAQVAAFLWRAAGKPEPELSENPFKDISSSAYYYKAVLWAVENGITAGKTGSTFDPNGIVTRAQVVTFLWRAAGKPEPASSVNKFSDVSSSAYYYKAVLWAVENGITNGKTSTVFGSEAECSRAQVVSFMYRSQKSDEDSTSPFEEKYWIIFTEGSRNNRVEASAFDSTLSEDSLYIVWADNCHLDLNDYSGSDTGSQFYLDDSDQWASIGTYSRFSNHGINIIASNLDVYDENGNLVMEKCSYEDVDWDYVNSFR